MPAGKRIQIIGPPIKDILKEVSELLGVPIDGIISKSRRSRYVMCRRVFVYVSTKITDATWDSIGSVIQKDRPSCIFHRNKVEGFISVKDPGFMHYWGQYISRSKIWWEHGQLLTSKQ